MEKWYDDLPILDRNKLSKFKFTNDILVKELEELAKSFDYNISQEMCQYTGEKQYILFAGEWAEGIYVVKKGSKKSIIDLLKAKIKG